jgi:hypothetical protein
MGVKLSNKSNMVILFYSSTKQHNDLLDDTIKLEHFLGRNEQMIGFEIFICHNFIVLSSEIVITVFFYLSTIDNAFMKEVWP